MGLSNMAGRPVYAQLFVRYSDSVPADITTSLIHNFQMKYLTLLFPLLFSQTTTFSQDKSDPVEVTPAIVKKINQEMASEVGSLKTKLTNDKESTSSIEFTLDTFRIESFQKKYIDHDWSTAGMLTATYDAAKKYDSLLNKYYKKLLAVLKQTDKPVLANTQKSWITFRDNELKFIDTISEDEYSGGGTIQQLIDASEYFDIIKQRTITIYEHYLRATRGY